MRVDYMINLACAAKSALANPGLLPMLRANDPRVRPHAAACRACPASRNGEAFSCWGAIGAPILESTEDWLDGLLDTDPESVGISVLDSIAPQARGARVEAMRAQGAFERRQPYDIEWSGDDDETVLTMTLDQILGSMLFAGPLPPSSMLVYLLAFGVLPDDDLELIQAALNDPGARRKLVSRAPQPSAPPSPQTMAFLLFFGAMLRAVWLDMPLVIEVT